MPNAATMLSENAISGAEASCYVTIGEKRYNMMNMIKFKASIKVNKTKIPILGKPGKGNKPAGWEGTWTATAHYNTSVLRAMLTEYKNTGIMPKMIIEVINEDKSSGVGKQTVILYGCEIDDAVLAAFDADSTALQEDISGTFDDWKLPNEFKIMSGME